MVIAPLPKNKPKPKEKEIYSKHFFYLVLYMVFTLKKMKKFMFWTPNQMQYCSFLLPSVLVYF